MLDLRRLQILAALQSEGTMTAAATSLFMTTSAVSQQLQLLEREVGVPLVTKSGRRVKLTAAGLVLVQHAHAISAATEAAETSMKRFRVEVSGSVSLGAFPSFASTILPQSLKALEALYPDLFVTVSDLEPFQSVAELRAGRLDLAVIDDLHPVHTEGLRTTVLFEDELTLCLPESYSDLPPGPLDIAALSDAKWIMDARQSVFEIFVRSLCIQKGFEPRVVANCSNLAVTLSLIEAGVGVGVIGRTNALRNSFNVVCRPVAPRISRKILLACRESSRESPLIVAVATELAQHSLQLRADA